MIKKFEFSSSGLEYICNTEEKVFFNTDVYSVSTINNPKNNTVIFSNKLNDYNIEKLKKVKGSILILSKADREIRFNENFILYVENPRKEYAKVLKFILDNQKLVHNINYELKNGSYIGKNVKVGENTIIEPLCFIDNNVVIGDNCIVKSGSKIRTNVIIGDECILKENCVIGSEGFGVERDPDGTTYKIPHLGGVEIKSHVEVGANSVIAQGTIEPTIIEDYVKIDDCAFIAHNVKVGRGTFIIANSEISGSVEIGKNCWVAPNVCIKDGIKIGDNSMLGMGAVIIKDVEKNSIVAGNPGKILKTIKD